MAGFNKGTSLADKLKQRQQQKSQTGSAQTVPTDNGAPETDAPAPPVVNAKPSASSILTDQHEAARVDQSVQLIDLDLIDVEDQVRKDFDIGYIEDLAVDIATSENKQPNQPVTLWKRDNGRFLLDDGENRYRSMKFARENKTELGINDPVAFTFIRATIRGAEPSKLDRVQSQAKANLLRDNLNDVEIGRAAQMFLEENPDATQTVIAKWLGFQKTGSGRVKVANALKLMNECDQDLIELVEKGELSIKKAFKVQDERKSEGAGESNDSEDSTGHGDSDKKSPAKKSKADKTLEKAKSGKKATNLSVSMDALRLAAGIIVHVAKDKGVSVDVASLNNLDRKELLKVFDAEVLDEILNKLD